MYGAVAPGVKQSATDLRNRVPATARLLAEAADARLSRRTFRVGMAANRRVHVFADSPITAAAARTVRGAVAFGRRDVLADGDLSRAAGEREEKDEGEFHSGYSRATVLRRGEGASTKTPTIPAMNPPMCAHQATPPAPSGMLSEATPERSCMPNQNKRYRTAGICTIHGKMKMGMNVTTRLRGKETRYAPSTPAIAPEAPTVGMVDSGESATWQSAAPRPHSR